VRLRPATDGVEIGGRLAAQYETLLDDMRAACRRVRDAWSELWR
jgi:hypothetical protein